MQKIPSFLKQYFWDVDFDKLTFKKSKAFILKRVLDRGDDQAMKWSLRYYTKEDANPKMLIPISWEEVKRFFQNQALKLAKNKLEVISKPPMV